MKPQFPVGEYVDAKCSETGAWFVGKIPTRSYSRICFLKNLNFFLSCRVFSLFPLIDRYILWLKMLLNINC